MTNFRKLSAPNKTQADWWFEVCHKLGMQVAIAGNGVTLIFKNHSPEEIKASYDLFRDEFARCIGA